MKEMQSAQSTYEKVNDMINEIKCIFDDCQDTLSNVISEDKSENFYFNYMQNLMTTSNAKLCEFACAIEDLKFVRNQFDDLILRAISDLKINRAKLEVIQKVVDDLR